MSFIRRVTERARRVSDVLKDEYAKGKAGDDAPVQSLGPTATDVLKTWLKKAASEPVPEPTPESTPHALGAAGDPDHDAEPAPDDAVEVAGLLKGVDWKRVSSSITESQTAQRMKDLAAQVDWSKAKPAAARVGTALIAAAASGQLGGLKGRTGAMVARTIIDQTGLAERVSGLVAKDEAAVSEPLRQYIDTTATEQPARPFETNLGDLGRAIGPGASPTADQ